MALKMTKRGQLDNEVAYEFVCDTTADLQAIDSKYVTMGSVATVIEGEAGFEVYMANSQKEWVNLGSAANSGGDSSGNNNNIIQNNFCFSLDPYNTLQGYENARNLILNNNTITGDIKISEGYASIMIHLASNNSSLYTVFNEYSLQGLFPVVQFQKNNDSNVYYLPTSWVHSIGQIDVYLQYGEITDSFIPKKICIINLSANEGELIYNINENDIEDRNTFANIIKTKEILAEYDISQLNFISDNEWDQAGE